MENTFIEIKLILDALKEKAILMQNFCVSVYQLINLYIYIYIYIYMYIYIYICIYIIYTRTDICALNLFIEHSGEH